MFRLEIFLFSFLLGIFSSFPLPSYILLIAIFSLLFVERKERQALFIGFACAYLFMSFKPEALDFDPMEEWIILGTKKFRGKEVFSIALTKDSKQKYLLENMNQGEVGDCYLSYLESIPFSKASLVGEFDEEAYFQSQGFLSRVRAKNMKKIGKGSFFLSWPGAFQKWIERRTEKMPREAASFLNRILLGSLAEKDKKLEEEMSNLGLSHLLAASGLHVGLVYSWGLFLLSYSGLTRKWASRLLFLLILIYAYLISFPSSILRAFFFLFFRELAIEKRFPLNKRKRWMISLLMILLFFPYKRSDLALALSFLCALALDLIYQLENRQASNNFFAKSLRQSFWISACTMPILFRYFSSFPILSILANMLVISIFSLLFALGLLSIFLPFLSVFYLLFYKLFRFLLIGLDTLPSFDILLPGGMSLSFFFFYFLFLFLFYRYRMGRNLFPFPYFLWEKKRESFQFFLSRQVFLVSFLLMFLTSFLDMKKGASFRMLDIGQGDAFLFRKGSYNFMFDTGGKKDFKSQENIQGKLLISKLRKEGIYPIHALFLSHKDYDHIGNLECLMKEYKVERIYRPKGDFPIGIGLQDQDKIQGEGFSIKVLQSGNIKAKNRNEEGLVLLLDFGPKILLTGDVETLDPNLVKEKIDIIKVAHHGGKKGTSEALIKTIEPSYALISVGRENSYGHPNKEVIDRLKRYGVEIYRTDFDEDVYIYVQGGKIKVIREKEKEEKDTFFLLLYIFFFLLFLRRSTEIQRLSLSSNG